MTEGRLASLYESDGFVGEKTIRAKGIRELIDEIRRLAPAQGVGGDEGLTETETTGPPGQVVGHDVQGEPGGVGPEAPPRACGSARRRT